MDWQKQMEKMVGTWTDMQRGMWDNWIDAVRRFGQSSGEADQMRSEYERQLAAWEASVQQALEAQKEWAAQWAQQASGTEQAPEPVVQWMEQMQAMMQGWTESQHQLWEAWFESLRTMDPGKSTGRWEEESREVLEAWQQAAERAREAMAQWGVMAEQMDAGGGAGGAVPTGTQQSPGEAQDKAATPPRAKRREAAGKASGAGAKQSARTGTSGRKRSKPGGKGP